MEKITIQGTCQKPWCLRVTRYVSSASLIWGRARTLAHVLPSSPPPLPSPSPSLPTRCQHQKQQEEALQLLSTQHSTSTSIFWGLAGNTGIYYIGFARGLYSLILYESPISFRTCSAIVLMTSSHLHLEPMSSWETRFRV